MIDLISGDEEDVENRFRLVSEIKKMNYGNSMRIIDKIAKDCWPSGYSRRYEKNMSTIDRILADIETETDKSFTVTKDPAYFIIHRKLECCPRCKGLGRYSISEDPGIEHFFRGYPTEILKIRHIECKHEPE